MARVTLSILRKKRVLQAQHVVKFYRTLLYRNLLGFAAHQCRRRSENRNTSTEMCTSDTLQYTLYSWNTLLETELKRGSGNAYKFIHVCSSYIVLTTQNQIIDNILWHSQGAHIEVAIRTKRIWRFSLPGHTSIEFRHRPRNEVSWEVVLRAYDSWYINEILNFPSIYLGIPVDCFPDRTCFLGRPCWLLPRL